MADSKLSWLLDSWAYRKAKGLVTATVDSQSKLLDLITRAQSMAALGSERFAAIAEPVKTAFRLVKRYARGDYRDVSLESIGLIVAALIYFVMPIDVLPDFLLAFGFFDDAALLAWTIQAVSTDLERFEQWEEQQAQQEAEIIEAEFERIE